MNGRAYDPELGRFTGVDPFMQMPLNSQSLNPYSYVLNNPIMGTDPTGYCTTEDKVDCLKDGVNEITDKDGNKVGTIVVANKGDKVSISGGKASDIHVKGDVHVAWQRDNGASKGMSITVEEGGAPDKIGSNTERGKGSGCNGGGPLQCYDVKLNRRGQVDSFERTYTEKAGTGAVNGMLNTTGYAVELMAKHIKANFGNVSEYMLAYNPTEGMAADLWESTRDKFGFTTEAASQFSQIMVNANAAGGGNWVAHSQGGVIFSEAMRVNLKAGVSGLANMRIQFDSGLITAGLQMVMPRN